MNLPSRRGGEEPINPAPTANTHLGWWQVPEQTSQCQLGLESSPDLPKAAPHSPHSPSSTASVTPCASTLACSFPRIPGFHSALLESGLGLCSSRKWLNSREDLAGSQVKLMISRSFLDVLASACCQYFCYLSPISCYIGSSKGHWKEAEIP